MNKTYYDSAALFSPRVKSENSPDFRGDIQLSAELCAYILSKANAGEDVKLNIALWSKQSQYGEYYSAKIKQAWEGKKPVKQIDDEEIPF